MGSEKWNRVVREEDHSCIGARTTNLKSEEQTAIRTRQHGEVYPSSGSDPQITGAGLGMNMSTASIGAG